MLGGTEGKKEGWKGYLPVLGRTEGFGKVGRIGGLPAFAGRNRRKEGKRMEGLLVCAGRNRRKGGWEG